MDQEKEQNTLLENIVLVSTEELAKVTIKDKPTESIIVKENTVDTKGHIDPNKEKNLDTPKDKEEQALQTLVNLPSAGIPTKSQQEPSTVAVPLKISTLGSSQSKVAKVLHYGDPFLDENIIIPHFESTTMTLDDLNKLQAAIDRKRQQEILRKEHRQKNSLQNIKDIFLDTFSVDTLDESKDMIDQLSDIVD